MLKTIFNLLWIVLGGLPMALGWWLVGLVSAISIVGLPWSRSCFLIGKFALRRFDLEAINSRDLSGRPAQGTGSMALIGTALWFSASGWWLAIGHLTSAFSCFVSIIGIPFEIQHNKLALIAMAPIGMTIVPAHRTDS